MTSSPAVMVRTRSQLAKVVRDNPFLARGEDAGHQHVLFTEGPAKAAVAGLDLPSYAPEEAIAVGHELYLFLPNGVGRSKLAVDVGRQKGVVGTMRNWRTVTTRPRHGRRGGRLTWTSSCSTRSARCCAGCCLPRSASCAPGTTGTASRCGSDPPSRPASTTRPR